MMMITAALAISSCAASPVNDAERVRIKAIEARGPTERVCISHWVVEDGNVKARAICPESHTRVFMRSS